MDVVESNYFSYKKLLILSFATSIDAFALGITFSFAKIDILQAIAVIGIVVFLMTEIGILIGKYIGNHYSSKFKILGGVVIILLSLEFLWEGVSALLL
ncbi:MAG: manganese efflux pump MntP family protein [Methanobrevibacter sp.]|jgi:putative Mn2+ efflux pump MntP|nr:manganese efflux pump MntP family protein [Methanobrevibacter sp.]